MGSSLRRLPPGLLPWSCPVLLRPSLTGLRLLLLTLLCTRLTSLRLLLTLLCARLTGLRGLLLACACLLCADFSLAALSLLAFVCGG